MHFLKLVTREGLPTTFRVEFGPVHQDSMGYLIPIKVNTTQRILIFEGILSLQTLAALGAQQISFYADGQLSIEVDSERSCYRLRFRIDDSRDLPLFLADAEAFAALVADLKLDVQNLKH